MGKVNLNINGRAYALGCEDGEEERLMRLGQELDARVASLADQFGQGGDLRLLVMAGIIMLDEMDELTSNVDAAVERRIGTLQSDREREAKARADTEALAAKRLTDAATRIRAMAERLAEADAA